MEEEYRCTYFVSCRKAADATNAPEPEPEPKPEPVEEKSAVEKSEEK